MKHKSLESFLGFIAAKNENQPEYLQATTEIMESLWPFVEKNPRYAEQGLLERLVTPERIIILRICWVDDKGDVHTNLGYRVQHSLTLGPYKGGIRFHPSVNVSIMKFLALEQTLKNSLTTLPMGGGKGGADFDPKGKSPGEIMRFCQAFMCELYRHIGAQTDVPAGDIGVGAREVGYMFGMYKKLVNEFTGVYTGKGLSYGGSKFRPEATGFGLVYFAQEQLKTKGTCFNGKTVAISGFGQVSWGAAQKVTDFGGKVVTLSGPDGYIYDEAGVNTKEKFNFMVEMKNSNRNLVKDYADKFNVPFYAGKRPWEVKVDVALPCAIQNELNEQDAKNLLANGVMCVSEGANMPCTPEAVHAFLNAKIIFGPGKAANAGGVSTSCLEMAQNATHLPWSGEEVDAKLQSIMKNIHEQCVTYGKNADGFIDYVKGANIGGFIKVAEAMLAQGVV